MESVFVYGSLKRGQSANHLLENERFMAEAKTLEEFCMYNMGYFPAVTDEEVSQIHGELYRVNETTLIQLDDYEGLNFDRIQIPVILQMSGVIKAWMYICYEDIKDGILIREGKWR